MRTGRGACLLFLLAVGCDSGPGSAAQALEETWLLVVDRAHLAAARADGTAWCPGGDLGLQVTAAIGDSSARTAVVAGTDPRFHEGMLSATGRDFTSGVRLALGGRCGQSPLAIGEVTVQPPIASILAGHTFLVAFGGETHVKLHFELVATAGGGPGWDGGGPGWDDDSCDAGCDVIDEEPADPGDDGGDPGNDGGWDDGGGDEGGEGFAATAVRRARP